MMDLQILFEMETIVEELSSMRMSRGQQNRVVKIRHCAGVISGYSRNGFRGKHDRQKCLRAVVKIHRFSLTGHKEAKSKKIRERFADLIEKVGALEAVISHELQNPGIFQKLKTVAKAVTSWLLVLS